MLFTNIIKKIRLAIKLYLHGLYMAPHVFDYLGVHNQGGAFIAITIKEKE
jgi:hypothetical protein